MNLLELEKKTNDIDRCVKLLVKQYPDVMSHLANIRDIISSVDSSKTSEIENLIAVYESVIKMFSQYYGRSVDDLFSYINTTKDNIAQLTSNLKATSENVSDIF